MTNAITSLWCVVAAKTREELLEEARFHEILGYVLAGAGVLILLIGVVIWIVRNQRRNKDT